MADDSKIMRSKAGIFISDALACKDKSAFADLVENKLGSFTGTYQEAYQALAQASATEQGMTRTGVIGMLPNAQNTNMSEEEAIAYIQAQEPKDDFKGKVDAIIHGSADTALATGVGGTIGLAVGGPPGAIAGAELAATGYGVYKTVAPMITQFLNDKFGMAQETVKETVDQWLTEKGIQSPDTKTERVLESAAQGLSDGLSFNATGNVLKANAPTVGIGTTSQELGKVATEGALTQIVGDTASGAGAQLGAEKAEEKDAGIAGQILYPLMGGALADMSVAAGSGALKLAGDLITAKNMEVPEAIELAKKTVANHGEYLRSDVEPTTQRAALSRAFRESIRKGTAWTRWNNEVIRKNYVDDFLGYFGGSKTDNLGSEIGDIAEDFLTKRNATHNRFKADKYEVLDNVSSAAQLRDVEAQNLRRALDSAINTRSVEGALGPEDIALRNWRSRIGDEGETSMETLDAIRNEMSFLDSESTQSKQLMNGILTEMDADISLAHAVPTPKTENFIADTLGELEAIGTDDYKSIQLKLEEWKTRLENPLEKDLDVMEDLRVIFSDAFSDLDGQPKKKADLITNQLYGTLKQDMEDFIKTTGTDADFLKYTQANEGLADLMTDMKATGIKQLVKNQDMPVAAMRNAIFSGDPADISVIVKRLDGDTASLNRVKSAYILDMYQKASSNSGVINPNDFSGQLKKNADSLGIVFGPEDESYVRGVIKYLNFTERNDPNFDVSAGNLSGKPAPGVGYAEGRAVSQLGLPATLGGYLGLGWVLRQTETGELRDFMIKFDHLPDSTDMSTAAQTLGKRLREVLASELHASEVPTGEAALTAESRGLVREEDTAEAEKVAPSRGFVKGE